jgi:hypothetical protein
MFASGIIIPDVRIADNRDVFNWLNEATKRHLKHKWGDLFYQACTVLYLNWIHMLEVKHWQWHTNKVDIVAFEVLTVWLWIILSSGM